MTALCGLFYGTNKMATDVDVQFFSHLNGLTLGNNWGDLIRLLDKALVTGLDFTQITAASIDTQGDVHITLYSTHNAMLFQVVELTGFAPASFNQKYRIKGVPNTTQLILKPALDIAERSITAIGTGKLASLGYEIIFRDTGDVKRVYRAKNPTAKHPYIRVDESIASATGTYTSSYAKSAMIGLLEHMDHIDDYENPSVLQLPFDPGDPAKNWKITGTGTACIRGWCKLYYGLVSSGYSIARESDTSGAAVGPFNFTIVGNRDAVFIANSLSINTTTINYKSIKGFGLFDSATASDVVPCWFLAVASRENISAGTTFSIYNTGGTPFAHNLAGSKFLITKYNALERLSKSTEGTPILHDFNTGRSDAFAKTSVAALQIPFFDSENNLRGVIKHAYYSGNNRGFINTMPILSETSMYLCDNTYANGGDANMYFYLGELE